MSADKRSVCVSPRRYPRKRNRLLLVTAQPFYDIIPPLSSWRHDASPIEIQLHPHHARLPTTMYRIIKFHKGGARHLPAAQTNQRVKFSTSQSLRLVWSEKKTFVFVHINRLQNRYAHLFFLRVFFFFDSLASIHPFTFEITDAKSQPPLVESSERKRKMGENRSVEEFVWG